MRRWNGWGDSANHYPLKASGLTFLQSRLGAATPLPDAEMATVLQAVPASRMPDHKRAVSWPTTLVLLIELSRSNHKVT